MSDLINEIRAAQIRAGEEAVVAHLRKAGLVDKEPVPKNSKVICLQQQLVASQNRVKALEDALRPFAEEAKLWSAQIMDDVHPGIAAGKETPVNAEFTVGDLRRCAALLELNGGECEIDNR